ncbi:phasin family protein [Desulfosporosinus sp. BICA1-9]|uniref:phasin family protein n=1 Tax=Desulfosporosinus sp. BICA1-9 TaxID=1531958 RepID=UPI00054C6DFF|nr:ATP synthase subunit B [Desulfosporosinus sp. BICA1-9]KJS49708.1 MAG: ATP synthase subunit B [Peptococcaceae bacterium BRH_c23]KJS86184.1 MAG: ATP synthase subunit B [Desulfosporosinus sp. BICA1-9]HBW34007.1 polyhydroxyalkanoate synthesis regulator [Desulfosporosinus sp.]
MKDLIKKGFALSLGLVLLSREQVEKSVTQLVNKGEVPASEAKELVNELIEKGEEQQRLLEDKIREQIKKLLIEINIASKEDLQQLEQRLQKLEQRD